MRPAFQMVLPECIHKNIQSAHALGVRCGSGHSMMGLRCPLGAYRDRCTVAIARSRTVSAPQYLILCDVSEMALLSHIPGLSYSAVRLISSCSVQRAHN